MTDFSLEEFYIPNHCLNQDEFPGHVIWKGKSVLIEISYDPIIECLEVFNAKWKERSDGCGIEITNVEVDGYIGLIFRAKLGTDVDAFPNVNCRFLTANGLEMISASKKIHIFRPSIQGVKDKNKVETLKVKFDSQRVQYDIPKKLKLTNEGKGTALLFVDVVSQDRSIAILPPPRIVEYYDGFFNDLKLGFRDLAVRYNENSRLLWNAYRVMFNLPYLMTEGKNEFVRDVFEQLNDRFKNDTIFQEEYERCILTSNLKNLPRVTHVDSFVDYMNSIGSGRVLLLNSIFHVQAVHDTPFKKEEHYQGTGELKLTMYDLGMFGYDEVSLGKMLFDFVGTDSVPIHLLFEWSGDNNGENGADEII